MSTTLVNFLSSQHRPELVAAALDDCLQELGLEYLDVSDISLQMSPTNALSSTSSTSLLLSKRVPAV
jgi:hypothetical protein